MIPSLMPKGVEHLFRQPVLVGAVRDSIFDAERRGAPEYLLTLPAQLRGDSIFDAERRGALEIEWIYPEDGYVIPSLMPKGVEHPQLVMPVSGAVAVIPSLMPKGVEHSTTQHSTAPLAERLLEANKTKSL